MTISSISIGTTGMQRASHQLEVSAGRIARIGVEGNDIDITSEMINVITAKNDFTASAKVVSAASDMSKALLDILV
ncbi:flagellar basal body rod C-terminal domain-containing protein [Devosia lucknowensis]|uniref:flagellar basal body rod C-terminal domain-containing protein n=1 Tax=Devosia lucknowensis TaxID=1096929 RepID=UPI000A383795|nr:flagellar basal body rod C-terminal domain-containing protein [Devosia lucknowensis]